MNGEKIIGVRKQSLNAPSQGLKIVITQVGVEPDESVTASV